MLIYLLTRPPPTSTLFPYTTLFRSAEVRAHAYDLVLLGNEAAETGDYQVGVRLAHELGRSEEHTPELQSRRDLVCRLLLEKKKGIRGLGCRGGERKIGEAFVLNGCT